MRSAHGKKSHTNSASESHAPPTVNRSNNSRILAAGIVLLFAILGTVLFKFSSADTTVASYEAESAAPTGQHFIYTDSTASGKKAIALTGVGSINERITTTTSFSKVAVRIKGTPCNGNPALFISLDNKGLVAGGFVPNTSWQTLTFNLPVTGPGAHTLGLGFPNDTQTSSCDRNLYIDQASLIQPDTSLLSVSSPSTPTNTYTQGQSVTASAALTNQTSGGYAIKQAYITARQPGATHTRTPSNYDFSNKAGAQTIALGGSLKLSGSIALPSNAPTGNWDIYATYQDSNGAWHDGASTFVSVGTGNPPNPTDTDKDGVPDTTDACPTVAGPASNHGCPITTSPLVPPTSLQGSAPAYNSVNLSWKAAPAPAVKYVVIRGGVIVANVGGTSYTDTTVLPSTSYSYSVKSVDSASNESAATAPITVKTPAGPVVKDTTPPTAPGSIRGSASTTTQIGISWNASTDNVGVAGYHVRRTDTSSTKNVTATSYGESGLTADTNYTWQVTAFDSAGNSSPAVSVTVRTLKIVIGPGGGGSSPCGKTTAAPAKYNHVIVVMMENHHYNEVIGNSAAPYMSGLAKQCAVATNYAASSSPSLPNYISIVSGNLASCKGTDNDPPNPCHSSSNNIMRQARAAGGTSKVYAETMTSNCQAKSQSNYYTKHNPYPYFNTAADSGACKTDDVPFGTETYDSQKNMTLSGNFVNDLNADRLANWVMIDPNGCNDTHDCGTSTGDTFIKGLFTKIFASAAYTRGDTAVLMIYDEYGPALPNIWISPSVKPGSVYSGKIDHNATLNTMESMLGYPPLGGSAPNIRSNFNL